MPSKFNVNPLSGKLDLVNKDASAIHANGDGGAAATINWAEGNEQSLTLTADCTLTFTNQLTPQVFRLVTTQNVGGTHAISWPAGSLSAGGAKPAPTQPGGSVDVFEIFWDGTNYTISVTVADVKTIT